MRRAITMNWALRMSKESRSRVRSTANYEQRNEHNRLTSQAAKLHLASHACQGRVVKLTPEQPPWLPDLEHQLQGCPAWAPKLLIFIGTYCRRVLAWACQVFIITKVEPPFKYCWGALSFRCTPAKEVREWRTTTRSRLLATFEQPRNRESLGHFA